MTARVSLIALLLSVVVPTWVHAGPRAHTSFDKVYQCAIRSNGDVFAASDGGLVWLTATGDLRSRTALDGLPGTRIYSLLLEGKTLWVGTEAGLAKASLVGSQVSIDRVWRGAPVRGISRHGHRIVIASWGTGAAFVDGTTLTAIPWAGGKPSALALRAGAVAAVNGTLYVGAGDGLYRLDGGRLVQVYGATASGSSIGQVWSLHSQPSATSAKSLVIGSVLGTYRVFDDKVHKIADYDTRGLLPLGPRVAAVTFGQGLRDVATKTRLSTWPSRARFAYHAASLGKTRCLATHEGLWLNRGPSGWRRLLTTGLPSNDITALARDRRGRVWAASFDRGLAVYDRGKWQRVSGSHPVGEINALAVDHNNTVWVATPHGLAKVVGKDNPILVPDKSVASRYVFSVAPMRGVGVIAGLSKDAWIITKQGVAVIGSKQGVRGNIWSVLHDSKGRIWLGTTRGLYVGRAGGHFTKLSRASGHLPDDWVMSLVEGDGSIYAGTYRAGVVRLKARAQQYVSAAVTPGWINPGGLRFHAGKLYLSTMDGGFVYDPRLRRARRLSAKSLGKDTTSILPTGAGMWIATRRGIVEIQ